MRVSKFLPHRPSQDPTRRGSVLESFSSEGEPSYDIYLTEGSVFVCRDGYVAVYGPQGTAYIDQDVGKPIAEAFAKRYPRPKKDDKK